MALARMGNASSKDARDALAIRRLMSTHLMVRFSRGRGTAAQRGLGIGNQHGTIVKRDERRSGTRDYLKLGTNGLLLKP